jgi:hypothetical protein
MAAAESVIGTRPEVEYGDQNEKFASILPRYGTIRRLRAEHDVTDRFLGELNEPLDYQVMELSTFRLLHCQQILVRSRWHGHQVGDANPASVFILLIPDDMLGCALL